MYGNVPYLKRYSCDLIYMLDDWLSCVLIDEIGYMLHVMDWLSWLEKLVNLLLSCCWTARAIETVLSINFSIVL